MPNFFRATLQKFGKKASRPHTPPASPKDLHPLQQTAAEGFGFFPGGRGTLLGKDQRYKIVRNLGNGHNSTVFLIEDSK